MLVCTCALVRGGIATRSRGVQHSQPGPYNALCLMAPSGSSKKVANSLVTLSSAGILAVYAAGLMKTRAAAEQMDQASNERRPSMPAPAVAGETTTPPPIEPPITVAVPTTAKSPAIPVAPRPVAMAPASSAAPALPPKAKKTVAPTPTAAPADPVLTPVATPAVPATTAPTATTVEAEDKPAPRLRPKEHYNDGTFLGWGTSRHGDIQASVKIEDGRIVAASIAQCWTRYSCSWVAHLPPQVVARQSPEVDYVSGATQSANAFYWAVIDALNKAK